MKKTVKKLVKDAKGKVVGFVPHIPPGCGFDNGSKYLEDILAGEATSMMQKFMEPYLRDMFAGHALGGLLAFGCPDSAERLVAKWAYTYADAMMEARKAKK